MTPRLFLWGLPMVLVACPAPGAAQLNVLRVDMAVLHVQPAGTLIVRVRNHGQAVCADTLKVQADMLRPGMPTVPGILARWACPRPEEASPTLQGGLHRAPRGTRWALSPTLGGLIGRGLPRLPAHPRPSSLSR